MTEESTEENITGDLFTMLGHYLLIDSQTPSVFLSVYLSACSLSVWSPFRCCRLSFDLSGKLQ